MTAAAPSTRDPRALVGLRVVMFVRNDVSRDVRVLREARSLVEAGHAVTVIGLQASRRSAVPDREEHGGFTIIRVAPPNEWLHRWRAVRLQPWSLVPWVTSLMGKELGRGWGGSLRAVGIALVATAGVPFVVVRAIQRLVRGRPLTVTEREDVLDWLVRWRWSVLGWGQRAAGAAPPADVYHGHDLNALPAAAAARDRGNGRLVYDSHELFLEAGAVARQPRWARRLVEIQERRLTRESDAVISVNESIAQELRRRYQARRTVVVRNCPPRWSAPANRPRLVQAAASIPEGKPVVLYHGGFLPDRGLHQLAAAILEPGLERAHLVYLGYGPEEPSLRALAADPRFAGRVHVLPPVEPDELLPWVASADVAAMPNQPATRNELYSTPNKLFESIAAGTPVVSSDTPERRRIVIDDPDGPLGELCDPTSSASIASAIRRILDLPPGAAAELRARCLKAGRERYNWERESAALVELYADLSGAPATVRSHDARR
jgi:glycosyltransferase involved in cell wall biosynthesis